jgi:hypothetical protein
VFFALLAVFFLAGNAVTKVCGLDTRIMYAHSDAGET